MISKSTSVHISKSASISVLLSVFSLFPPLSLSSPLQSDSSTLPLSLSAQSSSIILLLVLQSYPPPFLSQSCDLEVSVRLHSADSVDSFFPRNLNSSNSELVSLIVKLSSSQVNCEFIMQPLNEALQFPLHELLRTVHVSRVLESLSPFAVVISYHLSTLHHTSILIYSENKHGLPS